MMETAFAGPWQSESVASFVQWLISDIENYTSRPKVIAIDGRSGNGKTTLANSISEATTKSAVVHTDDIAWHHSFFDWMDLLHQNVLLPAHAGEAVRYRPEAWEQWNREGVIVVPQNCSLLIIEGVGASHKSLMPWIDTVIWVQADNHQATTRGIIRDGGSEDDIHFWDECLAEEVPYLAEQKPWERADIIVLGTPFAGQNMFSEVVLAQR